MTRQSDLTGLEVAIIGIACRFPEAPDHAGFWDNLKEGKESVHFLSAEELAVLKGEKQLADDKKFVPSKGASLTRKEYFDYAFFGYTLKEASAMDPQARVMHECVWTALEDAGCDPFSYPGKIGLIAGLSPNYSWLRQVDNNKHARELGAFHASTLVEREFSPLNIAYRLNFRGPCYSIFTTCSTSLVAVHQACRALLTGESNMMIAGGVSFSLGMMKGYIFQEGMIYSADGHCRAFDKDSSGTVRGEGAGFIVLKRLKDALQDNDHIYAVIKGSAVNNDGKRKSGFFAPSVTGQKEVVQAALKVARVEPRSVTLIEAHGTGTYIGDPVEIAGLTAAFDVPEKQFCAVGSVKTNIGHLDAAAGIAGLIKTVLSVHHKWLAPSLNYKEPNPHINFQDTPFYVNDMSREWEGDVLRAGVSAFGIGGTNAHVILENFDVPENDLIDRPELFMISARTEDHLMQVKTALISIVSGKKPHYNQLAYTLQTGRKHFPERLFAVTDKAGDLEFIQDLFHKHGGDKAPCLVLPEDRMSAITGLFDLARYNSALHDLVASVSKRLGTALNCSITALHGSFPENVTERLYCFCYQYVLTDFLEKLGAIPDRVQVSATGQLVMLVINKRLSFENALEKIVSGDPHADLSGALAYPFFALIDEMPAAGPDLWIADRDPREDFIRLLKFLGSIWQSGVNIDLNYFNGGQSLRKMSLPTSSFDGIAIESPGAGKLLQETSSGLREWLYTISWKKYPGSFPVTTAGMTKPAAIIWEDRSVCADLAEKIFSGWIGPIAAGDLYYLDEMDPDECCARIRMSGTDPVKIIILLGFRDQVVEWAGDRIKQQLQTCFFTLLDLFRLLGREGSKRFEIDLLLNTSYSVAGFENVHYWLAPIHALQAIIPLEMHNIGCRIIDIDMQSYNDAGRDLLKRLLSSATDETIFALRRNSVWVKRLQRFYPEKLNTAPSYIRDKGTYLIAGGFGGMGYSIALYLLEQTSARVVLLGRTPLAMIKADRKYEAFLKYGERVDYYAADITDAGRLKAVAEMLRSKSGPVTGIFHAAGLADYGGIADRRSNDSIDELLGPKVYGTIHLFTVFDSAALEFMVLFSSVGNILYKSKVGQLGYNAANEFLDMLPYHNPKFMTIGWSDWKEAGMTVDAVKKRYGVVKAAEVMGTAGALSNHEAIGVLNCILNSGQQHVIVSKEDLFEKTRVNIPVPVAEVTGKRFTLESIKNTLQIFFRDNMEIEVQDEDADFFELGADSLVVIDSLPKINALLDIKLTVNSLYQHATLKKLSRSIFEENNAGNIKKVQHVAEKLSEGSRQMFLFPPAIGIGLLAYEKFPAALPGYGIHAINFLPEQSRLDKYCTYILEAAKGYKVVLLGYSAGGTLAYEVARALGKNTVSCLVLLDTYIYRIRYTRDRDSRKVFQDFLRRAKENYGETTFKDVTSSMARYYFYVNNLVSAGTIDAPIHLIKAVGREEEEGKNRSFAENNNYPDNYKPWDQLTVGDYREYDGAGMHGSMLAPENLSTNLGLIKKILQ